MVNILLEGYDIDAPWLRGDLRPYIRPSDRVAVVAFSFRDNRVKTAGEKVERADILYFLGGLPDRMLDRIEEFSLTDALLRHRGVVMGYSAGAVIQLGEYHLSPDEDYPEFAYYRGLPYLEGFYLEVHYEGTEVQKDAVRRVLAERGKPVYATALGAGALLAEDGKVRALGKVERFGG